VILRRVITHFRKQECGDAAKETDAFCRQAPNLPLPFSPPTLAL
jgi:hypothetical protein